MKTLNTKTVNYSENNVPMFVVTLKDRGDTPLRGRYIVSVCFFDSSMEHMDEVEKYDDKNLAIEFFKSKTEKQKD